MLLIVFHIDDDRFGLDVDQVIEVAPIVLLKKAAHTPGYVAGLFNYRGTVVPVIDLTKLITGKPSQPLMSTRIVLVDYTGADNAHHILGIMVERVMETVNYRDEDFQPPGFEQENTQYLGDIIIDENGMIQRIKVDNILPESLQKLLFKKSGETL